jgi:hypothetical protein
LDDFVGCRLQATGIGFDASGRTSVCTHWSSQYSRARSRAFSAP